MKSDEAPCIEKILSEASPLSETRGIYYLIKDKKIVYIGQSIEANIRVRSHKKKDYDSYYIHTVAQGDINSLEAEEILRHQPKYNSSIPSNSKWVSMPVLKALLCASANESKKFLALHNIGFIYFRGIMYCNLFAIQDYLAAAYRIGHENKKP